MTEPKPRGPKPSGRDARLLFRVQPATKTELRDLAKEQGVTPAVVARRVMALGLRRVRAGFSLADVEEC